MLFIGCLHFIHYIEGNVVFLKNGSRLPVGQTTINFLLVVRFWLGELICLLRYPQQVTAAVGLASFCDFSSSQLVRSNIRGLRNLRYPLVSSILSYKTPCVHLTSSDFRNIKAKYWQYLALILRHYCQYFRFDTEILGILITRVLW